MRIRIRIRNPALKSLKKGVDPDPVSQECGSADPDPHQNVTDPQHWYAAPTSQGTYIIKHETKWELPGVQGA